MCDGSVSLKSEIGDPAGCGMGRCRQGAEEWSGRRTRVEVRAVLVLVSGPTTCPGFSETAAGFWLLALAQMTERSRPVWG